MGDFHTYHQENIKLGIEYPCIWHYRIIGHSRDVVLEAIREVFNDTDIVVQEHFSKNKKYVSLNYSCIVHSEEERVNFFDKLVDCNGIIMVI